MPLYDFECPACGYRDELLVRSDIRTQPCPKCTTDGPIRRVQPMRRQPSAPGLLGVPFGRSSQRDRGRGFKWADKGGG